MQPLGQVICISFVSSGVCGNGWVLIDQAGHYVVTGACGGGQPVYDVNMQLSMRHELGHIAGLSHTGATTTCGPPTAGDDAMVSDWSPASLLWLDYNPHHIGHVDGYYP